MMNMDFIMGFGAGKASAGPGVEVESLTATENKTYTAPTGKAYSPVVVNVPASGGGNVVHGSFKGTDEQKGTAVDIDLAYTGTGFPVCAIIALRNGADGNTDLPSFEGAYAAVLYCYQKANNDAPSYQGSGTQDNAYVDATLKSKTSASTSVGGNKSTVQFFKSSSPSGSSWSSICSFKSATKMPVFIASTSYGFGAGLDYDYTVIYSS